MKIQWNVDLFVSVCVLERASARALSTDRMNSKVKYGTGVVLFVWSINKNITRKQPCQKGRGFISIKTIGLSWSLSLLSHSPPLSLPSTLSQSFSPPFYLSHIFPCPSFSLFHTFYRSHFVNLYFSVCVLYSYWKIFILNVLIECAYYLYCTECLSTLMKNKSANFIKGTHIIGAHDKHREVTSISPRGTSTHSIHSYWHICIMWPCLCVHVCGGVEGWEFV